MSAIDDLLSNHGAYARAFSKGGLPAAPAKRVAIVACMDARLETGRLLGLVEGDAHVIRNAGGVVTEDVVRSLMISQHLLGTREVMLIHHTDCGMLAFSDAEVKDAVEKRAESRPPFPIGTFSNLEENLRASIRRIRESPFLVHKDRVRGFVYEVDNGRLREVE